MGLEQFQRLLARLYTEPALRARFQADPRGVGAEFGLDGEESDRLAGLSVRQVGQFAGSLVVKRRNEVEKLLPSTRHALGPERFTTLFQRFAAGYVPSGVKKHRDDALRFVAFLEDIEPIEPAWVLDIARLEVALLLAHDPRRRWVVRRFRYNLADLSQPEPEPKPRPTFALWFRWARGGRLRFVHWSGRESRWTRKLE